jgi:hypothetical protein
VNVAMTIVNSGLDSILLTLFGLWCVCHYTFSIKGW